MNSTLALLLLHLAGFFLGSLPIGYLLAKARGVDIRSHGSGNVGATNVGRTLGKRAGIVTLIGDTLKGVLSCAVALASGYPEFAPSVGLAAIAGHCFSPFLGFRGGKGVATSLGVFLVIAPLECAAAALVFVLSVWRFRYISLGSILAAATVPLLLLVRDLTSTDSNPLLLPAGILTAMIVIGRHQTNIRRLLAGEESRFASKGLTQ